MMITRPLAVVGNVNVDLIIGPVAPWPNPGSEVMCPHDELRVGGAAGNAALAWEAIGMPFQIAANLGSDQFGAWLAAGFSAHSGRWARTGGATTLSVGITHPDGERTFFTTPGHLPLLAWPEVEAMIDWPALAGGHLLLCGCFLTERLTRDYGHLFARARAHDIAIVLDTGWPPDGWTDDIRTQALAWIGQSGMVLFNDVEARSLTGESETIAAARRLAGLLPESGVAVVKRGAQGALAVTQGALVEAAAPSVDVCDTIGAGDIFNAGFLAALARGQSLPVALKMAVETASIAVSTHPRRYTSPAPAEMLP